VREDSKMRQVVLWLLCTSSVLLFAQSIAKGTFTTTNVAIPFHSNFSCRCIFEHSIGGERKKTVEDVVAA
uniref:Uncharacterized protein n=1 Tax=Parascaris univalens TaxID=6257 RepID=A0A915B9R1_PARUN